MTSDYDALPTPGELRKRFWLFIAERYYPNGGMRDFAGAYDSIEEAEAALPRSKRREIDCHILDTRTKRLTVPARTMRNSQDQRQIESIS